MNKIYKVIWSKTRNCYVAVAEFVKRNGKGGSVLNRRHIAAALATVAICAAPAGVLANTGGHWAGDEYIGDAPYNITINEQVNGIAYGRYETGVAESSGATLSIVTGGKANAAFGGRAASGAVTGNKVKMTGGEIVRGNAVLIDGGGVSIIDVSGMLFGGFADDGKVEKNTVELSGGTVGSWLTGGLSLTTGDAANNTVTIRGGTINGYVFGGYSEQGNAENNTVILSKEGDALPVINGTLFGGFSAGGGTVSDNTLQVEAAGLSAPGIRDFDKYRFVLPKDIKANDTMLKLTNQNTNLEIDGANVSVSSNVGKTGLNLNKSITLLHKERGRGNLYVYNLPSEEQTAKLDGVEDGLTVMKYKLDPSDTRLNLKVSELYLYGDGGKDNTPGQRESGNTLTFGDGTKANAAFGGMSATGLVPATVTGNTVTMEGGELVKSGSIVQAIDGGLIGGYNANHNGVVKNNTAEVKGGTINGNVHGGRVENGVGVGVASENHVIIRGGTVTQVVSGGYVPAGMIERNTVTVYGGTIKGQVFGGNGRVETSAKGNIVTIIGGTIGENYAFQEAVAVTGGSGKNSEGNTVNISGGTVKGRVSGGSGTSATSNTVSISGGRVEKNVYGGQSVLGDAKANEVTISGGTLGGLTYVYGGRSEQGAAGGTDPKDGNKVTITGGTVGTVQGGYSRLDASYNSVVIAGDTVQGNAYGGQSTQGNALNNSVTVKEGTAGWVFGGYTELTGMKAAGNKVTITGGVVQNVYGGWVDDKDENGDSVGGSPNPATATENTVEIRGGTVNGSVYGGRSALGSAERNTVILAKEARKNAPNLDNAILYGGFGSSVSDNTLQVEAVGLSALQIMNFDNYKFVLPSDIKAGDTMLKLKGQGENFTIDGNKVSVTFHELNLKHGESVSLLSVENGQTISGSNLDNLWEQPFRDASPDNSVVLRGTERHRLYVDTGNTRLNYAIDHIAVDTVQLGATDWQKDATLLHGTSDAYLYDKVTALDTAKFAMRFAKPETVAKGDSMTLLAANDTLRDMAAETKQNAYQFTPVAGVMVDAAITGSLAAKSGNVTYTVDENRAGKLTFGNVQWKDSGALLKRPGNITFAGAEVDTQKIHFTNVEQLKANQKMTLVSDFGNSVGTITGDHYTVGTTLHGKGKASLQGSDLIYTVETGTHKHDPDPVPEVQPQTHNVLMAMTAGMQMVKQGGDFMDKAASGLGASENTDADGSSVFAAVGGGAGRTETGSHVKTHTWNGIVAVGASRKIESDTFQWGVFGEYGKGNYSLHNDTGRGDGDAHYAGGGLLAKWTNKHDVYTEVGVHLGRMSDKASDLLEDADGNRYGYDIHTNYYGAHLGFGKVFRYKGGRSLDVYGKYFYTKRDGADFEAGGHYSLDSVKSSVLRVGARYGTSDKRWNWYGGLAYEYEFDGKSTGTADGRPIRAASIKGGSVRGEVGLRMEATQKNPWQADISLTGYAGRHRGFGGNVSVAYTF